MKFGIGIIVYNPDENVAKRVEKYSELTEDIYIYDNSYKQNDFKNKSYYYNGENNGLTKALKWIFNQAKVNNLDYILTMDQDSDFSNSSILAMVKIIEETKNRSIAIFCPNYQRVYFDSNNEKEIILDSKINNKERKFVDFSMTSGSFINVSYIKDSFLNEDYFIGYVDNDLCYDFFKHNYKILMIGEVIFSQRVGTMLSATKFNSWFKVFSHDKSRYYYMVRNNLYLQKKYQKYTKINIKLKLNLLRILFNLLFFEKDKIQKIIFCKKGFIDYKKNVYGSYQGD